MMVSGLGMSEQQVVEGLLVVIVIAYLAIALLLAMDWLQGRKK